MPLTRSSSVNTQLAGNMMHHAIRGCLHAAILTYWHARAATAVHSDLECLDVSYNTAPLNFILQCIYPEVATRTPIKPKPVS